MAARCVRMVRALIRQFSAAKGSYAPHPRLHAVGRLAGGLRSRKHRAPISRQRSRAVDLNAPHLLAVGDSLPCRLTIQNLSLAQSGTVLGGSGAGFNFSCGASTGSTFSGIPVANGRISGDSVAFDIGTENVRSVGKVSGDSMSGITTFRIELTTRTVVLTGPFTAVRK